ncbi:MAG: hypothetical protein ACRDPA_27500 [Solirubrobacteraceae bacterium]
MAIAPATLKQISDEFLRVHRFASEDEDTVRWQLALAAEFLPEPAEHGWIVNRSAGAAALHLLATEALFTLTAEASDQGDPRLEVASHRVCVTEVKYWRNRRRTHWDFGFRDRDPLTVEGRIGEPIQAGGQEPFDQPETFARALAKRAGWDTQSEVPQG